MPLGDQPAPLPDYDTRTRSTAADQPAPLPSLNSCRPACSFTGLQSNMPLGRGWGGDDKRTRSTAADQPALLPDYKVTWLWGGGGGG